MSKILLFAGTHEGRLLSEMLSNQRIGHTVCVATEYGKEVIKENKYAYVLDGRLDQKMISDLISKRAIDIVIDATHPYAEVASRHIHDASEQTKTKYIRVVRDSIKNDQSIIVDSFESAITYLQKTSGNILMTTGSKQIHLIREIEHYQSRVFARVLPDIDSIEKCHAIGLPSKQIIAIQGPFTASLNQAMIEQFNIQYLVMKDSGTSGGTSEKLAAAMKCGIQTVIIGRPSEEQGMSLEEAVRFLLNVCQEDTQIEVKQPIRFPFFEDITDWKVTVIGAGKIATRRVNTLLQFSCKIKIVAPSISEALDQIVLSHHQVTFEKRNYRDEDIDDSDMVLIATNDTDLNHHIVALCKSRGIRCNNAAQKEENDFYFPAIIPWQNCIIAISGNGSDHKMTKKAADMARNLFQQELKD